VSLQSHGTGDVVSGLRQTKPCQIKGNINKKGVKIYHMPGGAIYRRTKIDQLKGERWFCSEEQARVAGWRRSKREGAR
jgi:hypothetical protein